MRAKCRQHTRPFLTPPPPPPQVVAPKRLALADANRRLEAANKKLGGIRARVKELQEKVETLEEGLMHATEDKNVAVAQVSSCVWVHRPVCVKHAPHGDGMRACFLPHPTPHCTRTGAQAERTAAKAALAERLITGLAGEYGRWSESIAAMAAAEGRLPGDALLAAAFVSYAGAFNAPLRAELVAERWLPDLAQRHIPHTQGVAPLDLLTDESTKVGGWGGVG